MVLFTMELLKDGLHWPEITPWPPVWQARILAPNTLFDLCKRMESLSYTSDLCIMNEIMVKNENCVDVIGCFYCNEVVHVSE